MLDWKKLVSERNGWVAHNFPDGPSKQPVHGTFGVMEEAGELAHAHLKEEQQIRMHEDHVAKAKDAIGDIMIYLLGIINWCGYYPDPNYAVHVQVNTAETALLRLGGAVGTLCRASSEATRVGIHPAINKIVYYARRYCELREWDFDQIVTDTWNEVKKRDWIANPDDADKKAVGIDLTAGQCKCYTQGRDPRTSKGLRCLYALRHSAALDEVDAPLMGVIFDETSESPNRSYPFPDGDTIVLGPQVFVATDGSVLNWRGKNYVPQP